jgi:hypothetical protein
MRQGSPVSASFRAHSATKSRLRGIIFRTPITPVVPLNFGERLNSMDGKCSFYQQEKYFYSSETGECTFYQQGTYFYAMKGGETLFYQRDKYLYSMDGTSKYYFS